MRTRLTLVILLITSINLTSLNAQVANLKVTKSEIFKDKNTNSEIVFTASDGKGGVILVRQLSSRLGRSSRGYLLEYYDSKLKLVKQKEFEDDDNQFKQIFIKNDKINILEYKNNKKNKSNDYNIISANLSDFAFTSKNIFSISKDDVKSPFAVGVALFVFSNFNKIDHDPTGEVKVSTNGNFIAFNFDVKNDKKETHRIIVYDGSLNKVYEKEFSENLKDKYFIYNSFDVSDEDGTVYFLGKAYKNDSFKDRVKDVINYYYKLYSINGDKVKSSTFDTNDSYINSLEILLNKKGVFCIGMYSEKNSSDYRGFAFFKLDKNDLKIQKTKLNPFTEQFMIEKFGEKKGKKKSDKEKEIGNVRYKDFYITENDEIFFNAEEFYTSTYTSMGSNGTMTTRTVYHYNDIYSCKFNFDGDILWMLTINKGQASSNVVDYLSFSSGVKNGKMYLFLNAADEVKKLKDNRIGFGQSKTKKMNLYVIEIDEKGAFNYKILISDEDSKVTYKTYDGIFSNGIMFFEGNKGRDKSIVKIEL